MQRGTLFVLVDGHYVPIAPCTVDRKPDRDGFGVFVVEEHERGSAKTGQPVTFRRIGSITPAMLENIDHYDTKSEETASGISATETERLRYEAERGIK